MLRLPIYQKTKRVPVGNKEIQECRARLKIPGSTARVKILIEKKYKEYTQSLKELNKENSKRFWSYFRFKTKYNYNSYHDSIKYKNKIFTSAKDKAEAFNQFFFSTFSRRGRSKHLFITDSLTHTRSSPARRF